MMSLPQDDTQKLSTLPPEDFIAWTLERATEYQKFASTLLTLRNAALPIHKLPAELLSAILSSACKSSSSVRFTEVCQLWRSLLLSTPHFWAELVHASRFHRTRPLDVLPLLLDRSATLPVKLDLRFWSDFPSPTPLIPHRSRITSLTINVDNSNTLIAFHHLVAQSGMPVLKSLHVRVTTAWRTKTPEVTSPWSSNQLPSLRRLEVQFAFFPYMAVPTLRNVALKAPYDWTPTTMSELSELSGTIARCGQLRTLHVEDIPWPQVGQSFPPLPSLRHLNLCDRRLKDLQALVPLRALSSHVSPRLADVDIHYMGYRSSPTILTVLPRLVDANAMYGPAFTVVAIDFADSTDYGPSEVLRFRARGNPVGNPSVNILCADAVLAGTDLAMVEHLSVCPLDRLVVRAHSMHMPSTTLETTFDWSRVLGMFSSLTTLHAHHAGPALRDLLAVLAGNQPAACSPLGDASTETVQSDDKPLACPRLRELELVWRVDLDLADRGREYVPATVEVEPGAMQTCSVAETALERRSRLVAEILPVLRIRTMRQSRLRTLLFGEYVMKKNKEKRKHGGRYTSWLILPLPESSDGSESECRDLEELKQLVDTPVRYRGLMGFSLPLV